MPCFRTTHCKPSLNSFVKKRFFIARFLGRMCHQKQLPFNGWLDTEKITKNVAVAAVAECLTLSTGLFVV